MARPLEKTARLPDHVREDILSLFVTLDNARDKLNLRGLTIHQLREAMRGYDVRPETAELIHRNWLLWCHQYLRGFTLGIRTRVDFNGLRLVDLDHPVEAGVWDAYLEKERMELERRLKKGLPFDAPQREKEV